MFVFSCLQGLHLTKHALSRADHALAVSILKASGLFDGVALSWSNDGY